MHEVAQLGAGQGLVAEVVVALDELVPEAAAGVGGAQQTEAQGAGRGQRGGGSVRGEGVSGRKRGFVVNGGGRVSRPLRCMRSRATRALISLRFLHDPDVSFTNDAGERGLRMAKVKIKVSGCFRTQAYGEAYACISSYLQSMAALGYNPLVAIQIALAGHAVDTLTQHYGPPPTEDA